MGKICKNANIYTKDGDLIRHVNENGELDKYSIEELENIVDTLSKDLDENGNVKNPFGLNFANSMLMQMYMKYGNPHEEEIMNALKDKYGEKPTGELVQEALKDLVNSTNTECPATVMDEYVPFEECTEDVDK